MAAGSHRRTLMVRSMIVLAALSVATAVVAAPALKPADYRILYVAGDDGDRQIYSVKLDGTGAEKLTSGAGNHLFPAWSPDGKKIAYSL
jgi:Tol biopolymer transport system component